jgi:hypothetical protein
MPVPVLVLVLVPVLVYSAGKNVIEDFVSSIQSIYNHTL